MTNGEIIDEATVPNPHGDGEYISTLRFVDWERPDGRDTQGHAVPRYSVQVTAPDGRSESFTAWGSIHAAKEQDPTLNVSAISLFESVLNDGLMFYHEADGTHDLLDRNLTAAALQGDLADAVDNLAAEWEIDNPSEAVRALGGVMETARKLRDLGMDYHPLMDVYEAVRDEIGG